MANKTYSYKLIWTEGLDMLIGCMRVSIGEQNLDLQRDGLERAGCERVYDD